MRVLISGAAGFFGRHFYEHFTTVGDEVVAFDTAKVRPDGVYSFEAREFFLSSGITFDLALHFAAVVEGREVIENDPMKQADNAALDAAFFRWAVGHTKVAVYPSSSAVYGIRFQEKKGQPLSESMFHPDQSEWAAPDEWYGTEKLMAEYLAWQAAKKYHLNTLCIRPFSGYGEDRHPVIDPGHLSAGARSRRPADGMGVRQAVPRLHPCQRSGASHLGAAGRWNQGLPDHEYRDRRGDHLCSGGEDRRQDQRL